MSKNTWELSIDGAALEEMKSDFDRAINAAVMAMRQKPVFYNHGKTRNHVPGRIVHR